MVNDSLEPKVMTSSNRRARFVNFRSDIIRTVK
jgi:hypothetical protein